jgi:hypothetical protein
MVLQGSPAKAHSMLLEVAGQPSLSNTSNRIF